MRGLFMLCRNCDRLANESATRVWLVDHFVGLRQVTTSKETTAALKDVLQAIMDTADKQGWTDIKRLAAASLATY